MNSREYERVNGEFQYQGEFYKLVEQKLENDTLYVVCLKDTRERKLFEAMTDYVKLTNDLPTSSQKNVKLFGSMIKDYVKGIGAEISKVELGWSQDRQFADPSFHLVTLDSPVFSPPPEC
jgi:hypothetical protein